MKEFSWTFVTEPDQVEDARSHMASASVVGVDTEYDSFRYFREKLCLLQVSTESHVYLFDPLGSLDFSFLGPLFSDPAVVKVLHASDNDVRILNREYGFVFSSIFDTHRAAAFLGSEALSLPAVMKDYLGEELPKSKKIQRSRWDVRPLSEEQMTYAARDAACLLPLYRAMIVPLRERGLEGEAQKVFDEIAEGRWREKKLVPQGYRKIPGYEELDDAARCRLKTLWGWRFEKARTTNRARFLILSDQNLVDLARKEASSLEDMADSGLLSERQVRDYGPELLEILRSPEKNVP